MMISGSARRAEGRRPQARRVSGDFWFQVISGSARRAEGRRPEARRVEPENAISILT